MKLLHLGDLHIGKSISDYSMIEDQEYIFNQIMDIVREKGVEAVVIAGDVYDKSIPSEEAVRVFDSFICKLAEENIQTYIISGNHDSDERLNFGSSIFEAKGIHIASKFAGELYKHTLEDEFGPVNIYLLPFVKASQVKHFYPDEDIDSYDKAVRTVIEHAAINTAERNVLVAHQFVVGKSGETVLGGSENASVQNVGTVEKIDSDCFDAFDYTALGHIHSPQYVGMETIRYSGSPLKYSLSEVNNEKSVPVVTLGEKGDVNIELVKLKPRRDMRHIKGQLKQLLDSNNITDPDDYIYVTLTDEDPVTNAMAIIRQFYPNTLNLDYENSHTKGIENADISGIYAEKTFDELISEFYRERYGCDISEDELSLILEIAGKAGI